MKKLITLPLPAGEFAADCNPAIIRENTLNIFTVLKANHTIGNASQLGLLGERTELVRLSNFCAFPK